MGNGAKTPSQAIKYSLCMDTKKGVFKRTEVDGESFTFGNESAVVTYNATDKVCKSYPAPSGALAGMPFSMIQIDAGAVPNGTATVDGQENLSVYTRHRQAAHEGHFFRPAEDMFWFLNKHNELVRGTCVIHKQAGYPMDTVASHDYFGRGKYTTDIPSDAFALTVPKGVVCN